MNFITRTVLSILILSSCIGLSLSAMNQESISCKNMSKQELIQGIKLLPKELKRHIIYLLLQRYPIVDFEVCKTFNLKIPLQTIAFYPDKDMCVAGSKYSSVLVYDYKAEKLIATFTDQNVIVSSLAFSSDGERFLSGSMDNSVCMYDSNKRLTRFSSISNNGSISVVWSPDGETALVGVYDGTGYIWNLKKAELIRTLKRHVKTIGSVAFSPEGERCITGSHDCTACVWNSKTGQRITTLLGHTDHILSVGFSPDGERCITGSKDFTARVWNSTTGELLVKLQGGGGWIKSVAFSKDGENCFTVSEASKVCLWNSKTGELLSSFSFDIDYRISLVTLSGDGEPFVAGFKDSTVRIAKPVYCFGCYLTSTREERAFKYFMTLYPLLLPISDT